jgi:uncharacterized protein (TIGR02145 family)
VTSNPESKTGTGASSPITVSGLTNGTSYTFTVVATNAIGNSSPSAASSSVTPSVPATVPGAPTSVSATAGNAQATVSFTAPASNGGSAITGYTVTSNPGNITGTGASSPITVSGLTNGTSYTFTVVATNAIGNSSPSTASSGVTPAAPFTCTSTITDVDGNTYNTVLIGTQCWTKENLRVTKYRDGTTIPDETSGAWSTLATGARTDYTGATGIPVGQTYVTTYGYLYNWFAVNDARGLCPTGWHVPTNAEWTTLPTYLGGDGVAGGKMKSTATLWNTPNTGADNSSSFSALPSGYRNAVGSFDGIRNYAYFWTASANGSNAWFHDLNWLSNSSGRNNNSSKVVGYSVRCLRD